MRIGQGCQNFCIHMEIQDWRRNVQSEFQLGNFGTITPTLEIGDKNVQEVVQIKNAIRLN